MGLQSPKGSLYIAGGSGTMLGTGTIIHRPRATDALQQFHMQLSYEITRAGAGSSGEHESTHNWVVVTGQAK